MDPLSAVSLAGNIVQFVQFSHDLLTGTKDILSSSTGARAHVAESQDIAELVRLRIETVLQQLDHSEQEPFLAGAVQDRKDVSLLKSLCDDCRKVAEELLSLLGSLRMTGKLGSSNTWEALYKAMQGEWKKGQVKALETRLDRMSNGLNMCAQEHQTKKVLDELLRIKEENVRLESSRTQDIAELRENLKHDVEQAVNKAEHTFSDLNKPWELLSGAWASCGDLTSEQKILRTLRFHAIDDRYDRIASAHKRTFEWIFDLNGPTSINDPRSFAEWLRSVDQPVYWISGKPGSGKSTLMKFLYNNIKTKEILYDWTGGKECIFVGYFFWAAASNALQKSQEGLLRSILYHILRKRPDQIRYAFADAWKVLEEKKRGINQDGVDEPSALESMTSVSGLLEAFSMVSHSLEGSDVKIFFLIDGLDEYEGEPKQIITLLGHMKASSNLKFCLASRSWNEFEEAYGTGNPWMLYVHDLTRDDITKYVHDKFEQDKSLQMLQQNDDRCPDLVRDIVDSARGVFLWVYLVVNSLLDGLTNKDRIIDLQRRLKELPTDLDELFERILESVSPRYRGQSARILMVADTAVATLPLMTYWYIDQDYLCNGSKEPCPSEEKNKFRLNQMNRRLNALSKGLLEAEKPAVASFFNCSVDFLHRTVADHLRKSVTRAKLIRWVGAEFDSNAAICNGILAHVSFAPTDAAYYRNDGPVGFLLHTFYIHAFYGACSKHSHRDETNRLKSMEHVLESLDQSTGKISKGVLSSILNANQPISPRFAPLCFGLADYTKTQENLAAPQCVGSGALECFLLSRFRPNYLVRHGPQQLYKKYEEILQILLEKGCQPNQARQIGTRWSGRITVDTIWQSYLSNLLENQVQGIALNEGNHQKVFGVASSPELRLPIIKMMLAFGASTTGILEPYEMLPTKTIKEAIQEILSAEEFNSLGPIWETTNSAKSKRHRFRTWLN